MLLSETVFTKACYCLGLFSQRHVIVWDCFHKGMLLSGTVFTKTCYCRYQTTSLEGKLCFAVDHLYSQQKQTKLHIHVVISSDFVTAFVV